MEPSDRGFLPDESLTIRDMSDLIEFEDMKIEPGFPDLSCSLQESIVKEESDAPKRNDNSIANIPSSEKQRTSVNLEIKIECEDLGIWEDEPTNSNSGGFIHTEPRKAINEQEMKNGIGNTPTADDNSLHNPGEKPYECGICTRMCVRRKIGYINRYEENNILTVEAVAAMREADEVIEWIEITEHVETDSGETSTMVQGEEQLEDDSESIKQETMNEMNNDSNHDCEVMIIPNEIEPTQFHLTTEDREITVGTWYEEKVDHGIIKTAVSNDNKKVHCAEDEEWKPNLNADVYSDSEDDWVTVSSERLESEKENEENKILNIPEGLQKHPQRQTEHIRYGCKRLKKLLEEESGQTIISGKRESRKDKSYNDGSDSGSEIILKKGIYRGGRRRHRQTRNVLGQLQPMKRRTPRTKSWKKLSGTSHQKVFGGGMQPVDDALPNPYVLLNKVFLPGTGVRMSTVRGTSDEGYGEDAGFKPEVESLEEDEAYDDTL